MTSLYTDHRLKNNTAFHPSSPANVASYTKRPARSTKTQHHRDAEQTWQTTLEAAARHWQSGEYAASITLQAEALVCAEQIQVGWAMLWTAMQLGVCRALVGDVGSAKTMLQRAITTATAHGQPVVAGLCGAIEGICVSFPASKEVPETARQQLFDIHRGLIQYLCVNQLPQAHVCWPVDVMLPVSRAVEQAPVSTPTEEHVDGQPDLRVNFLGGFSIHIHGQRLNNLPSWRSSTLLKYLLMHYGQMISFDTLLEQFWPDTDPDLGRNRLHQAIHCLRNALATASPEASPLKIVCHERRYGLAPGLEIWTDVKAFEQFVAAGRQAERDKQIPQAIAAYQEAIALYQGDFLPDDRYADWTQATRMRLYDLYLDAFDRLSLLSLTKNEPQAALDYCRQILALDRCREDVHQRIMQCHAMLGQRTQALRQYELCVDALRRELDLEPLPETTELYDQIKSDYPLRAAH